MSHEEMDLEQLLALLGIQSVYEDVNGQLRYAPIESLLAAVNCFGINLTHFDQVPKALELARSRSISRGLEPVIVAWDGDAGDITLRIPLQVNRARIDCTLEIESDATIRALDLTQLETASREQHGYREHRFRLPQAVPWGYHRLRVQMPGESCESLIISAPNRAYDACNQRGNATDSRNDCPPQEGVRPRRSAGWGTFLPLYAARSEHNWGAGDLTDLASLVRWTGQLGGKLVGTLPMSAAFLDEPFEPSPYAPASRLFWNEFYLDITAADELRTCAPARRLLASEKMQREIQSHRASDRVEYRRLMALKRRVLELLAREFFHRRSSRFQDFQQFVKSNPDVEDYARFRATMERHRRPWHDWPVDMRHGQLQPDNYAPEVMMYHLYVQWLAFEQMQRLSHVSEEADCGLYLDSPLGVHPNSFDVWRYQADYVTTASVGAPPDAVFTKGQDWQFPPLNPETIRGDGYRQVRSIIAHQMRFARQLRIDHVMSLHRLYWIPHGLPADRGVYVSYRPDEFYAILCLESHRQKCVVVGEDLGTVPPEVSEHMERHRIRRMHVVQYEVEKLNDPLLEPPAARTITSINTHDMPPFAAWWNGEDIADRLDLGLLDEAAAEAEIKKRNELRRTIERELRQGGWLRGNDEPEVAPDQTLNNSQARSRIAGRPDQSHRSASISEVLAALLKCLAASQSEMLLISLEDLWLERGPQNVPGTSNERANWNRKAHRSLEELMNSPAWLAVLTEVSAARNRASEAPQAPGRHPRLRR